MAIARTRAAAVGPALLVLLMALFLTPPAAAGAPPRTTRPPFRTPAEIVAEAPPAPPLPPRLRAKHEAARRRTLDLLASVDGDSGRGRDEGEEADRGALGGLGRKSGRGRAPAECDAPGYRERVVSSLREAHFLGLFKDLRGQTKLEASGMEVTGDDLWVVFDNTPLVGLLDLHFQYEDEHNVLIPPVVGAAAAAAAPARAAGNRTAAARQQHRQRPGPGRRGRRLLGQTDSQFEGISAIKSHPGEFMIVEEMREVGGGGAGGAGGGGQGGNGGGGDDDDQPQLYHPFAQRVALSRDDPTGYRVLERCAVHLALMHENKGVEGIEYIESTGAGGGRGYLMAACEGNWCSGGRKGRDRGNGKVVVLEYDAGDGGATEPCSWRVVKTLDMPRAAAFVDYSDLAFADPGFVSAAGGEGDPNKGAVAILSQEDSALWVGLWDYEKMEFDPEVPGAAFFLPRNAHCHHTLCNAEGLAWLDGTRLAVATDRAKANQPARCIAKDQTLGVFALPHGADRLIRGDDLEVEEEEAEMDEDVAVV